ncbi:Uncharacterised protein [Serratia fonticola]|uniref:Uncharacterized protein n=1 Tax=Serratia fonticola TaxID=47917 RepID=A0A4V6KW50_SERFO|nr:Uncharacterised protein [Serratia fonticola]
MIFSDMQFVAVFSGDEYTFTLANEDQINVITAVYSAELKDGRGEIVINDDESEELSFFSPLPCLIIWMRNIGSISGPTLQASLSIDLSK